MYRRCGTSFCLLTQSLLETGSRSKFIRCITTIAQEVDAPNSKNSMLQSKVERPIETLLGCYEPTTPDTKSLDFQYNGPVYIKNPVTSSEFNENAYIYKHIHERLQRFTKLGDLLNTLPISEDINQLRSLVGQNNRIQEGRNHYESLLANIKRSMKFMNQQELAILLTAIKKENSREFRIVKRMIDIELRWLLKKHVNTRLMDIDLWFYLADTFYECLMRSMFVNVLVNYLSREVDVVLSNRQFLHLFFLVILQRNQNGILALYEERVLQILNTASFEDIATISMAYFKTSTPIQNVAILSKIIDQTTKFLPDIDPEQPGYCSIIKAVRYSRAVECRENVLHLVMTLTQDLGGRIIMTSPYNLVHTIKLMESYRVFDPNLCNLLATTMFTDLEKFRIKDIQYALTSLSNFGYKDLKLDQNLKINFDKLSEHIASEVRKDSSFQAFHLLPLLRAFSVFGYYNDELITYANNLIKNSGELSKMSKVIEFERSALLFYVASRIEGEKVAFGDDTRLFKDISSTIDRYGNLGSVRQDSSIKHLDFILRSTTTKRYYEISNLFRTLAKALSNSSELQDPAYKFNFQYTLPHQNFADLVISKGTKEPGQFNANTLMPMKVPSGERHCLVMAVRKVDYVDGYKRLSGYKQLVTRLLTKLGYTVIHADINEHDSETIAKRIKKALDGSATER